MRSEEGEGGVTVSNRGYSPNCGVFRHLNIVGVCLKGGGGGGKGGHGHPRTPLTTPLRNLREFVATTPPPPPPSIPYYQGCGSRTETHDLNFTRGDLWPTTP